AIDRSRRERIAMGWTRLSFIYLVGYLWLGGLGLLAAPLLATSVLGSSVAYPPVLLRTLGGILVALGVVVADIARRRVEVLYPTTLVVRTILLAVILWSYAASGDLMFLSLAGIVALGMIFTGIGLISDRRGLLAARR